MQDVVKQCVDCGNDFTLTAGERDFFRTKALAEPRRCAKCRKNRKANQTPIKGGRYNETGGDYQNQER